MASDKERARWIHLIRMATLAVCAVPLVSFQNCSPFGVTNAQLSALASQNLFVADDSLYNAVPKYEVPYVGGSNFPLFSAGTYLQEGTENSWYRADNLKLVIGYYHENPEGIRQILKDMYKHGQRKIAFPLWFVGSKSPLGSSDEGPIGHVFRIGEGADLPTLYRENLRQVLLDVAQTGFDEVQIRFNPQGDASADSWPSWSEAQYQENWNFIVNIRQLVEDTLAETFVKRRYDLGGEQGGYDKGQLTPYVQRLWTDYTHVYGKHDTIGFSLAYVPGRLTHMVKTLSVSGRLPPIYGFDIYESAALSERDALKAIAHELEDLGEKGKPIYLQEAYMNDAMAAAEFYNARKTLGLNIQFVMQWPLRRGAAIPHFSVHYATSYDLYRALSSPSGVGNLMANIPVIVSAGAGCAAHDCVWFKVKNASNDPVVDVRSLNSGVRIAQYNGVDRIFETKGDETVVSIALKSQVEKALFQAEGLRFWIVNPLLGTWSEPVVVKKP